MRLVWSGGLLSLIIALFTACQPAVVVPTPTPIVIAKVLATAAISPTPNAEQLAATRAASSPTPVPPTLTIFPTITPYIGIFIGQAPRDSILQPITAPLLSLPNATPTADATLCRLPIQAEFLAVWQTTPRLYQRLGCPIQEGFGFFGGVQFFDSGVMYRRQETREVWALASGREDAAGRYWYVAEPERADTSGLLAPTGRVIPTGDFASVWLGVAGLQERFGFAQTDEQRVAINIQRFDGGTLFLDATVGQIFALLVDGTLFGPFIAPTPAELAPAATPTFTPATLLPEQVLTEAATIVAPTQP